MALESLSIVSEAIVGTAPSVYVASTADSLAVLTAPGYLNYLGKQLKQNDLVYINYADNSTFPLSPSGLVANFAEFQVANNAGNLVLMQRSSAGMVMANFAVPFSALAAGAKFNLITAATGNQFQVLGLAVAGVPPSVNFSGGGGNRLATVSDGTTAYSVIPAGVAPPSATVGLQNLVNGAWGSAVLPYPASASVFTKTVAGTNLTLAYSGGTADYTAGQLNITVSYVQVA